MRSIKSLNLFCFIMVFLGLGYVYLLIMFFQSLLQIYQDQVWSLKVFFIFSIRQIFIFGSDYKKFLNLKVGLSCWLNLFK